MIDSDEGDLTESDDQIMEHCPKRAAANEVFSGLEDLLLPMLAVNPRDRRLPGPETLEGETSFLRRDLSLQSELEGTCEKVFGSRITCLVKLPESANLQVDHKCNDGSATTNSNSESDESDSKSKFRLVFNPAHCLADEKQLWSALDDYVN